MNSLKLRKATFVGHEPCPACRKRGKDVAGDNLARYSDGAAFCFSCGYKERKSRLPTLVAAKPSPPPQRNWTTEMPIQNYTQLFQYLSGEEIKQYFKYDDVTGRTIFAHGDFYEARSASRFLTPKALQYGDKPADLTFDESVNSDTLVIVEDVISAIKVGRYAAARPLFGSSLTITQELVLLREKGKYEQFLIWLDSDKYLKAQAIAKMLAAAGLPAYAVYSVWDPKDCSVAEIQKNVDRRIGKNEEPALL